MLKEVPFFFLKVSSKTQNLIARCFSVCIYPHNSEKWLENVWVSSTFRPQKVKETGLTREVREKSQRQDC